jgi:glutathione S-transferase
VWGSVSLIGGVMRYLFAGSPLLPAEQRNQPAADAALEELNGRFRILEERLADRSFALGEAFSLVDVANASITWWASVLLRIDLGPYPKVAAWTTRCTERPAMARALAG